MTPACTGFFHQTKLYCKMCYHKKLGHRLCTCMIVTICNKLQERTKNLKRIFAISKYEHTAIRSKIDIILQDGAILFSFSVFFLFFYSEVDPVQGHSR